MESVTLTLAGRVYTIDELPMRQNAEWRKQLEETFAPLLDTLDGLNQIELNTAADLQKLVGSLRGVILHAPDVLVGLLFAYSQELQSDQAFIEENAYESEMLAAFVEVLKLAYPFAGMLGLARQVQQNGTAPKPLPMTQRSLSRPPGRKRKRG